MSPPSQPALPVVEIERRLHWRVLAVAGFLLIILGLGVVAAISVLVPVTMVTGLPADPEVAAARALLHDRLPMRTGTLRFRSALTGEAPPGTAFGGAEALLIERATRLIEGARARRARDPRLEVALAHLDLARQRYARAERRYRRVTDRGADVPEARLGLGVTLALEARAESDALRARALRLEALAQLVAVDPRDPAHGIAVYDRALLLAEIGRDAEARALAETCARRDSVSPWPARLRRALGATAD
jgi:hypothetical protein